MGWETHWLQWWRRAQVLESAGLGFESGSVTAGCVTLGLSFLIYSKGKQPHRFPRAGAWRWYRQERKWVGEGTGGRGRDPDLEERAAPSAPKCGVPPDSEGTPTPSLFPSLSQRTPDLQTRPRPLRQRRCLRKIQPPQYAQSLTAPVCICAQQSQEPWQHRCSQWKLRLRLAGGQATQEGGGSPALRPSHSVFRKPQGSTGAELREVAEELATTQREQGRGPSAAQDPKPAPQQ